MQYKGHIEHGTVVLEDSLNLPDETPVKIQVPDAFQESELHPDIRRLAGLLPEHFDIDRARLESIMEKHSVALPQPKIALRSPQGRQGQQGRQVVCF